MKTQVGDTFPESSLYIYNEGNMEKTNTNRIFLKKKIVLFGMPGAFTPTCSNYHIPSITNQMENLQQKGMYEVFCLVVNDIHVTKVWAEQTKALETGLKFITDPDGTLVNKLQLSFSAPEIGLINRSKRFCLILDNLIIKQIFIENKRGVCEVTSGKNIFNQIEK
jgi:cytochrome c peroxidase